MESARVGGPIDTFDLQNYSLSCRKSAAEVNAERHTGVATRRENRIFLLQLRFFPLFSLEAG